MQKNSRAADWVRDAETLIAQYRVAMPQGPDPQQPYDQFPIELKKWSAARETWLMALQQHADALRTRCPRAVTRAQRASVERRLTLLSEEVEEGLSQAADSNLEIRWLAIEYMSGVVSDERMSAIRASEAARERISARQALLAQKPDALTVDKT